MLRSVKETINRFDMIRQGESVLVGVSGGSDSVALLHLLNRLAPEFSVNIAIAHLNHSLRPHRGIDRYYFNQ